MAEDTVARVPSKKPRVPWYLPKNRRYRRHLKFTREGKLFVFVTLGLGFGAVNTGTNLMYLVFGFMLSLIILSGVLSEHVLRKLVVTRRLPRQVFAGEKALIEVAVKNNKERLVSYSVEIEDHVEGHKNDRRCYFLKVVPGVEQVASYRRVFSQRGRVQFVAFRVATRFPFALFEKWRELAIEDELIVYPARIKTAFPKEMLNDRGEYAGNSGARGTETRELREYRSHDEMRAVHWKRSAARGRLVVREFEREAGRFLSIRIDNLRPATSAADWEQALETQISRAAYLSELALSRGLGVEICARGARSPRLLGHALPEPIFRFLALLEPVHDEAVLMASSLEGSRVFDAARIAAEGGERAA